MLKYREESIRAETRNCLLVLSMFKPPAEGDAYCVLILLLVGHLRNGDEQNHDTLFH